MAGFKDFVNGTVVDEIDMDEFLMRQAVMRFPAPLDRDNALISGIVANGMCVYTISDATYWFRVGGVWLPFDAGWKTYNPVWATTGTTAVALGNGTISGESQRCGTFTKFRGALTMGSTTTYGSAGAYTITLPGTATQVNSPVGQAACYSGSSVRTRHAYTNTATTFAMQDDAGVLVGPTTPFTFASANTLKWNGTFQV